MKTGYLVLENGQVFKGQLFGAEKETMAELVFTTSMVGYLEAITDPSYLGQMVAQTFPLIGNYGVIPEDFESEKPVLSAYIVRVIACTACNDTELCTLCVFFSVYICGFCVSCEI